MLVVQLTAVVLRILLMKLLIVLCSIDHGLQQRNQCLDMVHTRIKVYTLLTLIIQMNIFSVK